MLQRAGHAKHHSATVLLPRQARGAQPYPIRFQTAQGKLECNPNLHMTSIAGIALALTPSSAVPPIPSTRRSGVQ